MNTLTSDEVAIIQMALQTMIEDIQTVSKDPTIPFNPEARRMQKDILDKAKSAMSKIVKASGHEVRLDPYKEGDENEFFTKQS